MKLSVIIVNYNVKPFLEQCLYSVMKAAEKIDAEVFVVDNASVDGSCPMVREKFPSVRLLENKTNTGFSAANNQAIRISSGEFILLLNPDTVVEEDTFSQTLRFMEEHADAGGLGVKMIDGKGKFLPESKRGLPTPWVAFYKIFGLAKLFPRSRRFGKYHLSYLDENSTCRVDVLCGAFMLLRREVLDKTGLLDEAFFMYGEDIDLSYRILQQGYNNYYFPGSTIIHYKGESTKKESLNYVKVFYNAMAIFARKHFSSGNARIFTLLIHLAIYFRALMAIIQRLFRRIYLPLLDALLIWAGFLLILPFWERIMFEPGYYPAIYLRWVVPAYILCWLVGIQVSGGYRKPVNLLHLARGILWGTIALLIAYSLISEEFRFSRVMILIGMAWALLALPMLRLLFNRMKITGFELDIEKPKRIAIAGDPPETGRVRELLTHSPVRPVVAGYVSLSPDGEGPDYLGTVDQLKEIIRVNRIEEIIFCSGNLSSGNIIRAMLDLSDLDVDYKIAPPESLSIIGSNSIHTAGDLYLLNINAITRRNNRKAKRIFDIAVATALLLSSAVLVWFMKNKMQFFKNGLWVISGKRSWVGYIPGNIEDLPVIRKGVLHPGMLFPAQSLEPTRIRQLNILYAKDYRFWNDLEIVFRNWRKLDNEFHEIPSRPGRDLTDE
ncbi:MAG TPA: glycosyltransferase family 2 protein [Prolixibacteraceae bacterium]|nr:glycosyltransferase family 2 protein [Prolixibacteraceae bacterium]HQE52792.1 glycosyltransferase family 2 protein [Prolixibacteraceae bacterium]HQH76801.1 glycosyltransferase family 2 protein [Prolixibacteraceae bacterium]HQJ86063.1 glycosyltransferase family 2 protein [Prolixibacteraceae bacterium]